MTDSIFRDAYVAGHLSRTQTGAATNMDDTTDISMNDSFTTEADTTAPAATPPKRARIDPSIATNGNETVTPLEAATNLIDQHCASLHKGIATLLCTHARKYITLRSKLFHQEQQCNRLEKNGDDQIPVSARVNFRLSVPKEAEELPEYTELQNQVKTTIEKFQLALKAHIIASIKVSCTAFQLAANRQLCHSLHDVTQLFLHAQGIDDTRVHTTVLAMLDSHHAVLLAHSNLNLPDFQALYKTTLGVDCSEQAPVYQPAPNFDTIKRAIESTFISSWDAYKRQTTENELALSLKKRAQAMLLVKKTEDAVMQIDTEPTADPSQISELIRKEVARANQKLTASLAKNDKRGRPGASTKRNKVRKQIGKQQPSTTAETKKPTSVHPKPKRTRTQARRQQRARKAGDAASDSPAANASKPSKRSNSKSKQNVSGSKRKQNRS